MIIMSLSIPNCHDLHLDSGIVIIIIGDMDKPKTMTLKLTDRQLGELRDIAKRFGFVMERGRMAGDGSVQQMLESVADGQYHMSVWRNDSRS